MNKGTPKTEGINISCSAPPLIDNALEIQQKFEMFGLPVPKFPVGTKPRLNNTKKKPQNEATVNIEVLTGVLPQVTPNSLGVLPAGSTEKTESPSKEKMEGMVAGWTSVYEALGIPIPSYFSDPKLMQTFEQLQTASSTRTGSISDKKAILKRKIG